MILLCGHVLARVMFGEYGFLSKQWTSVFKCVNKSILSIISNAKAMKILVFRHPPAWVFGVPHDFFHYFIIFHYFLSKCSFQVFFLPTSARISVAIVTQLTSIFDSIYECVPPFCYDTMCIFSKVM